MCYITLSITDHFFVDHIRIILSYYLGYVIVQFTFLLKSFLMGFNREYRNTSLARNEPEGKPFSARFHLRASKTEGRSHRRFSDLSGCQEIELGLGHKSVWRTVMLAFHCY